MKIEKHIPAEVKEYMAIVAGTGGIMGLELFRKCKAIEDKYPEWFPWEYKYKSIPKNVHDAYQNEYQEQISKREKVGQDVVQFDTKPSLLDMIDEWQKNLINEQHIKVEQLKKERKLWYKHYKKYGLEFRY